LLLCECRALRRLLAILSALEQMRDEAGYRKDGE
jgi:hypothetical protein